MGGFNLDDKIRDKYKDKIDNILPLRTTSRLINCEDRYLKDDPRKLHRSLRSVELLVEQTLDLNEMADSKIIDLRHYISKSGKTLSSRTPEKLHELALKVREMYLSQNSEIKMRDRMIKNDLHLHTMATIQRIKDLKSEFQDHNNLDVDTKEQIEQLENQFRILLRLRKSIGQDLVWKKIANHYAYLTNLLRNSYDMKV